MNNQLPIREHRPDGVMESQVLYVSDQKSDIFELAVDTKYIELEFPQSDVASFEQIGDNLIITLKDGNVIVLYNYFQHEGFYPPLDFEDGGVLPVGLLLGGLGLLGAAVAVGGADSTPLALTIDTVDATAVYGSLVISGTSDAPAGSTVTLTMPSGDQVTAVVQADGTYQAIATAPQPDGTITATVSDGNGNTGNADNAFVDTNTLALTIATVDSTAPDGSLVISGTSDAPAGSTVILTLPSGDQVTAVVQADGTYQTTAAGPQQEGTITAAVSDGIGHTGTDSSGFDDTTPPDVTVTSVTSDVNGFVTVGGTATEPGADVEVTFPDGTTKTVTSDPTTGVFSATSDAGNQSDVGANDISAQATDVNNNSSPVTPANYVDSTPPPTATLSGSIQGQGNMITGTGRPGDTVTITNGGATIGPVEVLPDGTWSIVSPTPIADGTTLSVVQTDLNGVNSAPVSLATFTDTDGDGTADTADNDDDGDGIADVEEAQIQSTVVSTHSETAATTTIVTPSTGYVPTSETNVFNPATGQHDFTLIATSPGEATPVTGSHVGTGTISETTIDLNTVGGETFTNLMATVEVDTFDDGLYVEIDGQTVLSFNTFDYNAVADFVGAGARFDTGQGMGSNPNNQYATYWQPWYGEGSPHLDIDLLTGTIALMVDAHDGAGGFVRLNALDYMPTATVNALPTVDFEAGISIGMGFQNGQGRGDIGTQTVTVTGSFVPDDDTDTDTLLNAVDIDTDNDGIWDEYEATTDSDSDGSADFRDADSNGVTAGDDRSLVDLNQTEANALTGGTNSSPFIILEAGVSLDLTGVTGAGELVYIDMENGAGGESITLSDVGLQSIAAGGELIISGDAGDTVNTTNFTLTNNQKSIEGQAYDVYLGANNSLMIVDEDITVT